MTDRELLEAVHETVKEAIKPVMDQITEHEASKYAHPEMIATQLTTFKERSDKLDILWDERNEMKGIMRLLTGAALAGPALGAGFVWALYHVKP